MISVESALLQITRSISNSQIIELAVEDTLGFILANDVLSPINMPPFDQSAMDGYALGDTNSPSYQVIGELKAGDSAENFSVKSGEAIRIFTGGMVPRGTVTIAKQEIVERNEDTIRLTEEIGTYKNIRPEGEQIKKNEIALKKGTLINAGSIGFLYGIGIHTVEVFTKPKVIVIATGNELTRPGGVLTPGKIFESNTYTIQAGLNEIGINASIKTVEDDYQSTKKIIEKAIEEFDFVIMTGGISVGDYDFVGKALNELKVEQKFYKVKQKPGKPIYFGEKDRTFIFGLPGNPAAALTSFYIYVIPAIRKFQGFNHLFLETRTLILQNEYKKTKKMSHFLKAFHENGKVTILNSQSSAMLSSFAQANCIVYLEEGKELWEKDKQVKAYILP